MEQNKEQDQGDELAAETRHNHPREARALGFLRYGVDTWGDR